jgi:hypothetical protein
VKTTREFDAPGRAHLLAATLTLVGLACGQPAGGAGEDVDGGTTAPDVQLADGAADSNLDGEASDAADVEIVDHDVSQDLTALDVTLRDVDVVYEVDTLDTLPPDTDVEEADVQDRPDAPNVHVDRAYRWTDLHDTIDFDFASVPLSPGCEDSDWNPTPPRRGTWINFGMPPEGGIWCIDGLRVWASWDGGREVRREPRTFEPHAPIGRAGLTYSYGLPRMDGWFDARVVLDIGRSPGAYDSRDDLRITAERFPGGLAVERVVPLAWTETEFGWRLFMTMPERVQLHIPDPASACADGVLSDNEQCDSGLDVAPPGASPVLCDWRTCLPQRGVMCDETTCTDLNLYNAECASLGTDCSRGRVEPGTGLCYVVPDNDDERCVLDGETEGWCQSGICAAAPPECAFCEGDHRVDATRVVDGVCEPAPARVEFYNAAFFQFLGVGDSFREEELLPLPPSAEALYLQYEHSNRFDDPETGERRSAEHYQVYVESFDGTAWDRQHYPLEAEPEGTIGSVRIPLPPGWTTPFVWVELLEFDVENSESERTHGLSVPFGIAYSVQNDNYCQQGVQTSTGVVSCPLKPGRLSCGDPWCVPVQHDDENCGSCGNVCGELEVCWSGECRCHPVISENDPAHCGGCAAGLAGIDCDVECVGQVGAGIYCSGNGACDTGPLGTGRCYCDSGFHGPACEYSCRDGVRNGREANVDCGSACGNCTNFWVDPD